MTGYFQRMAELREGEMHYREIQDAIRLYVADAEFDPDRINYTTCPACGRDRKLMVVVTDEGRPFYRCFAATCGVEGFVDQAGRLRPSTPRPISRSTYATEDLQLFPLGSSEYQQLCARWPWASTTQAYGYISKHWRWSRYMKRVAMPHYAPDGAVRAYAMRSLTHTRRLKSITMPLRSIGPLTGWNQTPRMGEGRPLVLVEDPISAARLHLNGVSALCLGGTQLTDEACKELVDYGGRNYADIFVALDADATARGLALTKRLRGQMPGTGVHLLGLVADFKDMTKPAFEAYLGEF